MQITLNGWLTNGISLERGVFFAWRSWPPSSAALLGLRGYSFLVQEDCRRVFACMLMTPRRSSEIFDLDCVSVYENGSGAKLNRTKTEAMWLGAWRSRSDEPLGLTWVKKMRILGVIFGTISTEHLNWQPKLEKLEKSLNLWKSRSLSLPGKALIINMLGDLWLLDGFRAVENVLPRVII